MRHFIRAILLSAIGVFLIASQCNEFEVDEDFESSVLDQTACNVNESQPCYCADGTQGIQFCEPEGGNWEVCICQPPCQATPEVCDGIDNDCDSITDEGASDATTWYADRDNDGHGDQNDIWISCDPPDGYVASNDDINDTCQTCWLTCDDVCGDAIDNDCDGSTDFFCVPPENIPEGGP